MTLITPTEIEQFRAQLADYPDAFKALNAIEECEGDVEDAAMVLAIRAGLEPDRGNYSWLEGLARQCRGVFCQAEFKQDLLNGNVSGVVAHLATTGICPPLLVTPVVIYVYKTGVNQVCDEV